MGKPKLTLEQCQRRAQTMRGQCLSTKYVSVGEKLIWKCSQGHEWLASAASVLTSKAWCGRCSAIRNGILRRRTLKDCNDLAKSRGGKCNSTHYTNNKEKLSWTCLLGHSWQACFNAVKNGTWCEICANEKKRQDNHLGLAKIQELAAKMHGKCLSQKYVNVYTEMEFECYEGHTFKNKAANIIAGRWCKLCTIRLSERFCRAILEHLLGAPFPCTRPDWLLGKKKSPLELDGYNKNLGIAFEYQGIQHYRPVHNFKVTSQRVLEIQTRDRIKARKCKENGVLLIKIPYTVKHDQLKQYIRKKLLSNGITIEHGIQSLDLNQLALRRDYRLEALKKKAEAKQLKCLSKYYQGGEVEMSWQCKICSMKFHMSPYRLQASRGPCQYCRKLKWRTIRFLETFEKIRTYLISRGEKLISTEFLGHNKPLLIECKNKHQWSTSWASLRQGTKCKICRAMKLI